MPDEHHPPGAKRDFREQLIGWSLSLGFAAVINWVAFGPARLGFPGGLFVAAIAVALDLLLLLVLLWEIVRWRHAGGVPMSAAVSRGARWANARAWRWFVIVYLVGVALTGADIAVLSQAVESCRACGSLSAAGIWLFWVGASTAPIAVGLALVTRAPCTVAAVPSAATSSVRTDWSSRHFSRAGALAARISRMLEVAAALLGALAALGLICMIAVLMAGYRR